MTKTFETVVYDSTRTRMLMSTYVDWATKLANNEVNYFIDIDLAFQSRTRWSTTQKENFINSCLVDMNISKFILVDVRRCRDNSHPSSDDYKYFDYWLGLGVNYLNVDSNNRTTTIREFKNDKVCIPMGEYYIAGKGLTFTVTKDNNLYSTMDDEFRSIFNSNAMSTHIVVNATRLQLSELFERMNSGESLNFEEKINCSPSITCAEIRDLVDTQVDSFRAAKLFSEKDVNRRKIDGWFANVHYIFVNGFSQKSFSNAIHTKWYSTDSVSNKSVSSFVKEWKSFIKLIGKKINLFHYKWVLFDLFYLMYEQQSMSKTLLNERVVLDFIEMITRLRNDKVPRYSYDEVITDESVLFQYKQFTRGGDANNYYGRLRIYETQGWDISKYYSKPKSKDSKRGLTRIEKQGIAVRDGWKTNEGDFFEPETLFDGDLDAGHITAHHLGGETKPDNMVIEKASKNRSKGVKETQVSV